MTITKNFPLVISVSLLTSQAHAAPLLITQATDGVTIFNGEKEQLAPKQAFLLLDNQTLKVDEGSSVIVLTDELASKVVGPLIFGTDYKHPETGNKPNPKASAFLSKKSSNRSIAATRGSNNATVLHPRPDHPIQSLERIEIDCHECDSVKYEILQMPTLDTIHTFTGSPSQVYKGTELPPGEYALVFNDNYYGFVVETSEKLKPIVETITATKSLTSSLSSADALSIEAGIWFQEGFISQAFYVTAKGLQENPEDTAFKALYQQYYNPSKASK